jgi:hypothetical protein
MMIFARCLTHAITLSHRDAIVHEMADCSQGEVVLRSGNVAALFRANPKRRQSVQFPPV